MITIVLIGLTKEAAAQDVASEGEAEKRAWKQSDWFGPWKFEFSVVGAGGYSGTGGLYGGGLGVSLRHVHEFNDRPLVRLSEDFGVLLAVLSMGITAAPRGMWMGNEWGFDVRARVFQFDKRDLAPETRLALGIAPSFRISRPGSRFRYSPFLPAFVPEVGVGFVQGRAPEVLVQFHPFAMGFVLSDHVTLELEPTAMIVIPTEKRRAEAWFVQSLSVMLQ